MSEIKVEKILVTPALAALWLQNNSMNRPIQKDWVNNLADRMMDGAWMENGETIKIAPSGKLLDGQHRLQAVINSKVSTFMLVCFNVDEKSFLTIDDGRKRTAGHILAAARINNYNTLAAAGRWLLLYTASDKFTIRMPFSNAEILNFVQQNLRELQSATNKANPVSKVIHICRTQLTTVIYIINEATKQPETCLDSFLNGLKTGTMLESDSPILLARNFLLTSFPHTLRNDVSMTLLFIVLVKAWNYYIQKKTPKTFRGINTTTIGNEELPKPL